MKIQASVSVTTVQTTLQHFLNDTAMLVPIVIRACLSCGAHVVAVIYDPFRLLNDDLQSFNPLLE